MAANHDAAAAERVEAVLSLVATRADPRERAHLEAFGRAYLAGLDAEDVIERDALDLYGAMRSLWQVAGTRTPGEARVRVFNPSVDEQGWQSPHTVVEIVNDDMPFLVDSVQMEVLRQGLAVNLIAHPIVTVQRDATGSLMVSLRYSLLLSPKSGGPAVDSGYNRRERSRTTEKPPRIASMLACKGRADETSNSGFVPLATGGTDRFTV